LVTMLGNALLTKDFRNYVYDIRKGKVISST